MKLLEPRGVLRTEPHEREEPEPRGNEAESEAHEGLLAFRSRSPHRDEDAEAEDRRHDTEGVMNELERERRAGDDRGAPIELVTPRHEAEEQEPDPEARVVRQKPHVEGPRERDTAPEQSEPPPRPPERVDEQRVTHEAPAVEERQDDARCGAIAEERLEGIPPEREAAPRELHLGNELLAVDRIWFAVEVLGVPQEDVLRAVVRRQVIDAP